MFICITGDSCYYKYGYSQQHSFHQMDLLAIYLTLILCKLPIGKAVY